MQMQQIRHFHSAVALGSLRSAAQTLNITQPALTRSIQNLEQRLQVTLLERSIRGVRPTAYGQLLFEYADRVLHDTQKLMEDVKELKGSQAAPFHVGVSANFSHDRLSCALAEVTLARSHQKLTIYEEFYSELMERLLSTRIDMMVSLYPEGFDHPEIVVEPFADVTSSIVCRRDHPLSGRGRVTAQDLLQHRWITQGLEENERYLTRRFRDLGLPPPSVSVRTNSPHMLTEFLRGTDMLALVPDYISQEHLGGECVRVETELGAIRAAAGILVRRRSANSAPVTDFARRLRRAYAGLAGAPSAS